jgi:hypothetical protein
MKAGRFGSLMAGKTLVVCLMLSSYVSVARDGIIDFESDPCSYLRLFPRILSLSRAGRLATAKGRDFCACGGTHSRKRVDY